MKARFLSVWDTLSTSFWFVPALMIIAAVTLSVAMIQLDIFLEARDTEKTGWLWASGPEGARGLLSTIAGSMITVAGIVFSITIVALTLASSQFGPRLIRNFVHDKVNQFVLGTFVSTFVYSLLVLRTVRGGNGQEFVPHLSTTAACMFALGSLGVLIYFIHHLSFIMQAPNIVALVADELNHTIAWLFPEKLEPDEPSDAAPNDELETASRDGMRQGSPILAAGCGYLQAVDSRGLMKIAVERDLVLELHYRPGGFVTQGASLVTASPRERCEQSLAARLNKAFILGPQRTPIQDVEFAVDQLVEIAVRALSPGINDPFTAMTCIDRLGAALCHLAERKMPQPYRYDEQQTLRVIADVVTFAGVVDAAFNQIRQYSRGSTAVTIRLLETLAIVAERVCRAEDRAALLRQAKMIQQGSKTVLPEEQDRVDVQQRYDAALHVLTALTNRS